MSKYSRGLNCFSCQSAMVFVITAFTLIMGLGISPANASWTYGSSPVSAGMDDDWGKGDAHALRLQDGRIMIAYFKRMPDNKTTIAYRLSYGGQVWGTELHYTHTAAQHAFDVNLAQLPSGEVILVYGDYTNWGAQGCSTGYCVNLRLIRNVLGDPNFLDTDDYLVAQGDGSVSKFVPSIIALTNGQALLAYASGRERYYAGIARKTITFYSNGISTGSEVAMFDGYRYDSTPKLVKLQNGHILCVLFGDTQTAGWQNRTQWGERGIFSLRSIDNGATWTRGNDITNQDPYAGATFTGVPSTVYNLSSQKEFWPSIIQLYNGKILVAYTTTNGGSLYSLNINLVQSTDNGVTWSTSPEVVANTGYSEVWPALVQNPYGAVFIYMDHDTIETNSDDIWYNFSWSYYP